MAPLRPIFLAAALAFSLPVTLPAEARPRGPALATAAPGVTVDVSRLRALGLGPTADLLAAAIAAELREGGGVSGGGRVVVRLTGLSLNAYAGANGDGGSGGGGGSGGSGTNFDYLEGEVLTLGPSSEVLSRRPQISSLNASSGGAYYLPQAERNRVVAIAQHFAGWVKRLGV